MAHHYIGSVPAPSVCPESCTDRRHRRAVCQCSEDERTLSGTVTVVWYVMSPRPARWVRCLKRVIAASAPGHCCRRFESRGCTRLNKPI